MKSVLVILALSLLPLSAFGDIQVFPLRVMLTEKQKSAQLTIRHTGAKPTRYKISVVYYKMAIDGSVLKADPPEQQDKSAAQFFRYSPKEITLDPNVEQVVRIMTRPLARVSEGEYRAHLHFEAMDESTDPAAPGTQQGESAMQLKARIAVAIPIIVRKGNPALTVKLSDLKIEKTPDGKPTFSAMLFKEGDAFAYGDFELRLKTKKGVEKVVGEVKGISSYIPNRKIQYPIEASKLEPGTLTLIFKNPNDENKTVSTVQTEYSGTL